MLQIMSLFLLIFNTLWSTVGTVEYSSTPTATPAGIPGFRIISPLPGDVLQGNVPIKGSGRILKKISVEIEFAYAENPTDTWFKIFTGEVQEEQDPLGMWDTTTISDGVYTLRIKFDTQDLNEYVEIIPNLRVRNYSAIETHTPEPRNLSTQTTATYTPTSVIQQLTTTPLPTNPAQLTSSDIIRSIKIGIVIVFILFILGFIYTKIHILFP